MITQNIVNVFILASGYILIGGSFLIIHRIHKFLDVTLAIPFTLAPYIVLSLMTSLHFPLLFSVFIGLCFTVLCSSIINRLIFFPMRNRKAAPLTMMLASLGAYTVFVNVVSLSWGDDPVSLLRGAQSIIYSVLGASITSWQIVIICSAVIFVAITSVILNTTTTGKMYRAVVTNQELANISGIFPEKIVMKSVLYSSFVAGLYGVLMGIDTSIDPRTGLHAMFMGVVVAIVGGGRSIYGVVTISFLVACGQVLGVWRDSALWQDSIAFIILLVFLFVRIDGFGVSKIRKATT